MKAHPTQFIPVSILPVEKKEGEKKPACEYECNIKETSAES